MPSALVVKNLNLNHMPRQPILLRLGFRESRSDREGILPAYGPLIDRFIAETWVRVFYMEKSAQATEAGIVVEGQHIDSRLVRDRFKNPATVAVMGASARAEDVAKIRAGQEQGELSETVVLDAVLSEKVDFGLDFVEQEIAQELRRSGRTIGRRLSCGYGDFKLSYQRWFYETLQFAQYGIRLNERNILEPEKTVTALLPIYSGQDKV